MKESVNMEIESVEVNVEPEDDEEELYVEITENGLELSTGEIISEGRIVEIAREAKRLIEAKDDDAFYDLLHTEEVGSMDDEQQRILLSTYVTEDDDIMDEICGIEVDRTPSMHEGDPNWVTGEEFWKRYNESKNNQL
jgi:hypothetical protein